MGSDIAGTDYDAATANWGAPWRMPSLAQCWELLRNTTQTLTTQNGVNGRKWTGANGASVFLPDAGIRWGGNLYGEGADGYYWSSTLLEDSPYGAYDACFYYGSTVWYRDGGYTMGHTVRPVR